MKILIVEDDTLLLQGLILAAQTEGYACDGVSTARMAEQSLEAGHYSLVVLDLGLPDEDGLHFLARIRQKKYTLPVLILTARDTLTDKIAGLDVGADDYLVKPFALEELHARIRALLRRHNNQGESEPERWQPDAEYGSPPGMDERRRTDSDAQRICSAVAPDA